MRLKDDEQQNIKNIKMELDFSSALTGETREAGSEETELSETTNGTDAQPARPLGTGGALRNAADLVESDVLLVMNGDSYIDVDLGAFLASHPEWEADASFVVAPADGRAACGNVSVYRRRQGRQLRRKATLFGHGIRKCRRVYLLSSPMLYDIPSEQQVSLETELFRQWLAEGRSVRAFICQGRCFDIGTTERYRNALNGLAAADRRRSAATSLGGRYEGHDHGRRRLHRNGPYEVLLGSRLPGAWFRYP